MANPDFFFHTFDELATNGLLGDPQGRPAYAYLRVSSVGQAEEGRSGLPRQIMHVHEAAATSGLSVSWDMVFADDHSGFVFEDRPSLSELRREILSGARRGHDLVIENLDRLSRNADWHQGYLIDELTKAGVKLHFWRGFSSRIERAVIGAISQEGMEQSLARMQEGRLHKARNGRVTAKTRAYGYVFVDRNGDAGGNWRKDTHYALHPEEAPIVAMAFEKIAFEGMSCRAMASYLEARFPPPGRYRHWEPKQISLWIRNPLYKGEYIANRFEEVEVAAARQRPGRPTKMTKRRVIRPREDWIVVPVPPIVTPELWQAANDILSRNAAMSLRNSKAPHLLTGIIRCATCGYSVIGGRKTHRKNSRSYNSTFYRCSSRAARVPAARDEIGCHQGNIRTQDVDSAVWDAICKFLLDPQIMAKALGTRLEISEDHIAADIRKVNKHLGSLDQDDERLYRAYMAGAFDEFEFAQKRSEVSSARESMKAELSRLSDVEKRQDEMATQMQRIQALSKDAKAMGVAHNAPLDLKRKVIKQLVDRIVLDVEGRSLTITGTLPYSTTELPLSREVAGSPADRGSLPPP